MHLQLKSYVPLEGCVVFFQSEEVMPGSRPPAAPAAADGARCEVQPWIASVRDQTSLTKLELHRQPPRNMELSVTSLAIINNSMFFQESGPTFYVHIYKTFYMVAERYWDSMRQAEVAHCWAPRL